MISCLALIWFIDDWQNGSFKEWLFHTFQIRIDPETGLLTSYYGVWSDFKQFFIQLFLVTMILFIIVCWLVAYFYAKYREKKQEQLISSYIHSIMKEDGDTVTLPQRYAGLETKLVKIKSDIQRNRHLIETEMQRKNDLITYLAHDLKTPLASVIGYLSLLEEVTDLSEEQRIKYTSITLEKAYRLEQLINEFFEIIRFNLQKIVVNYEKIHLSYMLLQMSDEFYPIVTPQGKKVIVDVSDNLLLWGDADKLARVFNNILKNAIAYSYEDSVIYIEAYEEKEKITIMFTNQGDPIPAQKLETIFEKFYRLDSARSTKTGGAGLGLAIAKEIIVAHKGEIYVDSTIEKTIFTIKIPVKS